MTNQTDETCRPNLTLRNRVAGFLLIMIGMYVSYEAQRYGLGKLTRLGPGALPFGLGILMALLGAMIAILNPEGGENAPALKWRPLVMVLSALLSFALLIDTTGLLAATAALVFLSGMADPESTLPSLGAIFLLLISFVYIVFVRLLGIPFSLIGN